MLLSTISDNRTESKRVIYKKKYWGCMIQIIYNTICMKQNWTTQSAKKSEIHIIIDYASKSTVSNHSALHWISLC